MTQTTKTLGLLLVLTGIIGYFATGMVSWTAFIPAVYGAVFLLLGQLGEQESRRMVTMHLAQLLALLAIIGTFTGILDLASWMGGNQEVNVTAAGVRAFMALLCIGYLVLGIKSFIDARRAPAE
jgi:uncharacterized membrane protein (UPF0136 family)